MTKSNLLIIDDNAELRNLIRLSLEQDGYVVFAASGGQDGLHILRAKKMDTILLDLMLPDGDGLALIADIKKMTDAPVIVISGKGTMVDRVVGLEMGADDYLCKPFEMQELCAHVKANVRRYLCQSGQAPKPENVRKKVGFGGGKVLDGAKCQAFDADGNSLNLTAMEFRLLQALVNCPNCVMSRAQILDAVRVDNYSISDRAIDIHIARIRKRICADPKNPQIILTVRGTGYMLAGETEIIEE